MLITIYQTLKYSNIEEEICDDSLPNIISCKIESDNLDDLRNILKKMKNLKDLTIISSHDLENIPHSGITSLFICGKKEIEFDLDDFPKLETLTIKNVSEKCLNKFNNIIKLNLYQNISIDILNKFTNLKILFIDNDVNINLDELKLNIEVMILPEKYRMKYNFGNIKCIFD